MSVWTDRHFFTINRVKTSKYSLRKNYHKRYKKCEASRIIIVENLGVTAGCGKAQQKSTSIKPLVAVYYYVGWVLKGVLPLNSRAYLRESPTVFLFVSP